MKRRTLLALLLLVTMLLVLGSIVNVLAEGTEDEPETNETNTTIESPCVPSDPGCDCPIWKPGCEPDP